MVLRLTETAQVASWADQRIMRHVILAVLAGLFLNCAASPIPASEKFYVVVVDAGSSGSRIHTFTFRREQTGGNLILANEDLKETTTRLSAYVNDPEAAARSLEELLAKAKDKIPNAEWSRTPFAMKATAGLRLLPSEKAEKILAACKRIVESSGFSVSDDSVSILNSDDEGIYGWLTANYLSDRLSNDASKKTAAVLDLGGGSTQVTYARSNSSSPNLDQHIRTVNVLGQEISVYTESYLGTGLYAAREKILTHGMNREELKNLDTIEVHSVCIDPDRYEEWSFGGKKFSVHGPSDTGNKARNVLLSECEKIIDGVISEARINPIGLELHEAYAISVYYWAAFLGKIITKAGGETTVGSLETAAQRVCRDKKTQDPFKCLNLKYVSALLQKGFGLAPEQKLYIHKELKGYELSWALGAAFGMLHNGERQQKE